MSTSIGGFSQAIKEKIPFTKDVCSIHARLLRTLEVILDAAITLP